MSQALLQFVVFPLAAYLVGSIPFGLIIAAAKGVNLRAAGSGNIGATNVARVIGRRWGYLCFLLDTAKGFLPVLLVGLYLRRGGTGVPSPAQQAAWLLAAFAAIIGHILTVFGRFRGGKGVATSLGVLLGMYPFCTAAGAAALAVWVVCVLIWRYVSLASIVAAIAFPVLFVAISGLAGWPIGRLWPLLAFAILMSLLIIARHRSNIRRLLAGTENKVLHKLP